MAHFAAFTTKLRRYPYCYQNFPPDACLVLDDGSRHEVHRVILAANAVFFKTMFLFESDKREFSMEQVNKSDLTTFLDYAYTKEIKFTMKNIQRHMKFANYLQCHEMLKLGSNFLRQNVDFNSVIEYAMFAKDQQLLEVQKEMERIIRVHFAKLCKTKAFLDLPEEDRSRFSQSKTFGQDRGQCW